MNDNYQYVEKKERSLVFKIAFVVIIFLVVAALVYMSYSLGVENGSASNSGADTVHSAVMEAFESVQGTNDAPNDPIPITVYWVGGGSVWHTTPDCRALARSHNIQEGTIAESGKARACKICG